MQSKNPWRLPKHASSFFLFFVVVLCFFFWGGEGREGGIAIFWPIPWGGGGQGRGIAIFWPIPDLQVRTFGSFVASEGTFVFCTKLLGNYNTEQCQRKVCVIEGHFICTLVDPVDSFWHILPPTPRKKKKKKKKTKKKVEKVNKMPKYAISEMITLKVPWKQNKKQQ